MIFARPNGDVIEIRFKQYLDIELFKDYIDRIKKIRGRRFVANDKESYWTIPIEEQGYLKSLFEREEIQWEEEIVNSVPPKTLSDDLTYMDELKLMPYPFQVIGINFLCDTGKCLLADEMGLGKTAQIIGAAYKLFRQNKAKKALIICPSALKYQWEEEIAKFIDTDKYNIECIIIDGTPKQRVDLYDYIHESSNYMYVVINYELVLNDIEYLLEFEWDIIALDEGHRIRNWKSKTSKAIKQLEASYKWCATGTPLQNRPEELFNIFSFVNPKILGNWWKFRKTHIIIGEKFGQPNMILGYKNLGKLHQKISPYMIRRLKKDVAPELPEKIIKNYYVPMYVEQYELHERIWNDLVDLIKEVSRYTVRDENGEIVKQHPKANMTLGMFTMLQEVCDTPELLTMSASKLAQRYKISKNRSPKLKELVAILEEFITSSDNNKAVIFTQFSRMQELIVKEISKLGKCEIVNGNMNSLEKQTRVQNFKKNPEVRFLVATDAANYGINLEEASLLVNFDLPWNPAVWQQRNDRIHRLSSKHKSVNIINLIAKDGIDERILDVLYDKQIMSNMVIETKDNERQYLSKLTNSVMTKLLTKKKRRKRKRS